MLAHALGRRIVGKELVNSRFVIIGKMQAELVVNPLNCAFGISDNILVRQIDDAAFNRRIGARGKTIVHGRNPGFHDITANRRLILVTTKGGKKACDETRQ